jgi:hypothetical protein
VALQSRQVSAEGRSQRLSENSLSDAGHVFYEQVPSAERGDGNCSYRAGRAEHHMTEVRDKGLAELNGFVEACSLF